MNTKFQQSISILTIFISIICIVFMISYQRSIINEIAILKNYLINHSNSNIPANIITEYTMNNNYNKNLWETTLLNFGGISIVFGLLVLLITLVTGYFINQSFDEKLSNEMKQIYEYNKKGTMDLFEVINSHIGAGQIGYCKIEDELTRITNALNSYERLSIYSKHSFEKMYNADLMEMTKYIFISIKNNEIDKPKFYISSIISSVTKNDLIQLMLKSYESYIEKYYTENKCSDPKNDLSTKFGKSIEEYKIVI